MAGLSVLQGARVRRCMAVLILGFFLLSAASVPLWLQLASPAGTLRIQAAQFTDSTGLQVVDVSLPHAWEQRAGRGQYALDFNLEQLPTRPLSLFIPLLSQRVVVTLNGKEIANTGNQVLLFGVMAGGPALVKLPLDILRQGGNQLALDLESFGLAKGYLSELYVGTEAQLASPYWFQTFLLVYLRLMVFSMQLLVLTVLLVAWCYRPGEALFGWLLLYQIVTLPAYLGLFPGLWPDYRNLMVYAFLGSSASGFVLSIVALLVNGSRVPRWLKVCVLAVPGISMLLVYSGLSSVQVVGLAVSAPLIGAAPLVAAVIALWGALRRGVREAWVLWPPLLVLGLASLHDLASAIGCLDNPVYLAVYYRPLLLVGIVAILMRRLGISLKHVDNANANLMRQLTQRENELALLHGQERREAARRVRSHERQRLMVDLHDGLSGHLASIIALAERARARDIERSAREALDDLRIVILSLDIGDRELPVALSDFRDRLERQLKRLGMTLDWSIANLPEISGVTPTHALNVLRVLQEAVTNAIKHGAATGIVVRGGAGSRGWAVIEVENDGAPFLAGGAGSGHGLDNMRWRAVQLGGSLAVRPCEGGGARVELLLPVHLPPGSDDRSDGF